MAQQRLRLVLPLQGGKTEPVKGQIAYHAPPSLRRFCREFLTLLRREVVGQRMLSSVRHIVATDRWSSFDAYERTSRTLVEEFESAGAATEVYSVPTGGAVGTGRWIVQEAETRRTAVVDLVYPVRERLLDYRTNPWHLIGWSAATPPRGLLADLVVVDVADRLQSLGKEALRGKAVLTCLDPRRGLPFHELARRGAVAVISDLPAPNHPPAVRWLRFGFGGIDINQHASRIVGLVVSPQQGQRLRRILARAGRVTLRIRVDVRHHVGEHKVVSGLVVGRDDPQDEVWASAHCYEPGAADNASGVAVCLEIARILQTLIRKGAVPPPRRSIRLLSGFECYGVFHFLENVRRLQPPLAGVVIDTVGLKPCYCAGRLGWNATTPMTAPFADHVDAVILRETLRLMQPGYRLKLGRFVATPENLIADPKYGFPCPYLETDQSRKGIFDAYHSSADTERLLSSRGLKACAVAMAGYVYFLANAATDEALEPAAAETDWAIANLRAKQKTFVPGRIEMLCAQHQASLQRLQRWLWTAARREILRRFADHEQRVVELARQMLPPRRTKRGASSADWIPRRCAVLVPSGENLPAPIAKRIEACGLPRETLYWADGRRSLGAIAELTATQIQKSVPLEQIVAFFEAHAEIGYVKLVRPEEFVTRRQLIADLRALGVQSGMLLMVHSSLSSLGHVLGGPATVIEALLEVLGRRGTLVMPSFNHRRAYVFNPLTTPTINGAIADAMWCRPDAVRSFHPSHAVCAIGPYAEELCQGHIEAGGWGPDSPIGRLIQRMATSCVSA